MIEYDFDIKKLTQIVNYILKLNNYQMDYRKLIDLLYLVDREALSKWDVTITKDNYYIKDKE